MNRTTWYKNALMFEHLLSFRILTPLMRSLSACSIYVCLTVLRGSFNDKLFIISGGRVSCFHAIFLCQASLETNICRWHYVVKLKIWASCIIVDCDNINLLDLTYNNVTKISVEYIRPDLAHQGPCCLITIDNPTRWDI